ncbi:MAG: RdgB/HAM1 family non-canonical purine NTP pyrophosphatase [bacterium]
MKMLIATKNPDKIREIKEIIDSNIEFVLLSSLPFEIDVIEDGKTIEENAIKKAVEYAAFSSMLTLSEDSGLEIDYLNGAPGVYSSRFGGDISYDEKNRLIIKLLEGVPFEKRKARFKTVAALASPSGFLKTSEGIVEGFISFEPKGNNGFGYDPIFFYPEFNKTFGEVGLEEKNKVSHRASAIRKIEKILFLLKQEAKEDY